MEKQISAHPEQKHPTSATVPACSAEFIAQGRVSFLSVDGLMQRLDSCLCGVM